MLANSEFKLNAEKDTLNLPDYDGFVASVSAGIEEMARRVPQDGSITVSVNRFGGGYKVDIRLASAALSFLESGEGRSPFVALEKALLRADGAIKVWTINRKL